MPVMHTSWSGALEGVMSDPTALGGTSKTTLQLTPAPADDDEKDRIMSRRVEEYKLLRTEAAKRIEFRYGRLQLTILAAGAFFTVGMQGQGNQSCFFPTPSWPSSWQPDTATT